VDVRLVCASNRDLQRLVEEGRFREDLFYRLNVVPIRLPPLRERAGDVEPLARHFLRLAAREGLPSRRLSDTAVDVLAAQPWRGNVRELRNVMYRAALLARDDVIDADIVRQLLAETPTARDAAAGDFAGALRTWLGEAVPQEGQLYHSALAAFEKPLFEHALARTGGNQLRAAALLGINRNTLRKRLSDLDIDPDRFSTAS
jgi:two-component system nitrogen regulation response regulator GlnG